MQFLNLLWYLTKDSRENVHCFNFQQVTPFPDVSMNLNALNLSTWSWLNLNIIQNCWKFSFKYAQKCIQFPYRQSYLRKFCHVSSGNKTFIILICSWRHPKIGLVKHFSYKWVWSSIQNNQAGFFSLLNCCLENMKFNLPVWQFFNNDDSLIPR